MELMRELNAILSVWTKDHLLMVSTVFTTSLLVIYGDNINRAAKKRVRNRHFFLRALVFVVLCSFGYGVLTTVITPAVTRLLQILGNQYLGLTMLLAFIGIGILADQKKYM